MESSIALKKILVFEDQDTVIDELTNSFKRLDAVVTAFKTPRPLTRDQLLAHDVVILDIRFSNLSEFGQNDSKNGLEHLKHIRSISKDIPVIMYSVDHNAVTIERAFELGASVFAPKYSANFPIIDIVKAVITNDVEKLNDARKELNAAIVQPVSEPEPEYQLLLRQEPHPKIIELINSGKDALEVANHLGITTRALIIRVGLLKNALRNSGNKSLNDKLARLIDKNDSALL